MPLQTVPRSIAKSYKVQQTLTAAAVLAARRAWGKVDASDIDASWAAQSAGLAAVLTGLQRRAAADAADAVPAALEEQGTPVESRYRLKPGNVSGFAGAGYEPESVFLTAPIVAKARIGAGWSTEDALVAGGAILSGITQTAMADAGRQGGALGILTRPKVSYTRMLNPPSCMRCAILAGQPSGRVAFQRHPRCDCRAIPTIETAGDQFTVDPMEYFNGLSAEEQARIFTKAGAKAINDGADIYQVVNARRGMSVVQGPGSRTWMVTREGTTRRGIGARSMKAGGLGKEFTAKDGSKYTRLTAQRLLPETIYDVARDEADAKRLLKLYGYI